MYNDKRHMLLYLNNHHKEVSQQETKILIYNFANIVKNLESTKEDLLKTLLSFDKNFGHNYTKDHLAEVLSFTIQNIKKDFTDNEGNIKYAYLTYANYKREIIKRGYKIEEYKDEKKTITIEATRGEEKITIHGSEKIPIEENTNISKIGLSETLKNGLLLNNITTMGELLDRRKNNNKESFKKMKGLGNVSYRELKYFLEYYRYIPKNELQYMDMSPRLFNGLEKINIRSIEDILDRRKNNHKKNFKGMEGLGWHSYDELKDYLIYGNYIDKNGRIL